MTNPYLSVIVPAYNEEARITTSLPLLTRFLEEKPYSWEVIVVDDGSSDATGTLVREWAERHCGFCVEADTPRREGRGSPTRHAVCEG